MKANQIMKEKNHSSLSLMINVMSIHTKEERETHRGYQVHTGKTGEDIIPSTVYLTKNHMP